METKHDDNPTPTWIFRDTDTHDQAPRVITIYSQDVFTNQRIGRSNRYRRARRDKSGHWKEVLFVPWLARQYRQIWTSESSHQALCPCTISNFPVAARYETEKTRVGVHYVSSHQDAELYRGPTQIEFIRCEDGNNPQEDKNHRYDQNVDKWNSFHKKFSQLVVI